MDGVSSCTINAEKAEATVVFKKSQIDGDRIAEILRDSGYDVGNDGGNDKGVQSHSTNGNLLD